MCIIKSIRNIHDGREASMTREITYRKDARGINCGHTRESIAQAIRDAAKVFAATSAKQAASDRLEAVEARAILEFGYTWDEVEAIEIEAYSA